MEKHSPQRDLARAIRRSRAMRARRERRRRRSILLAGGAALAVAIGFEFSVASFGGMNIAEAAVSQAKSLVDLLNQRSPGARTAAELTKTKRNVLADREVPEAAKAVAELIVPPLAGETPELDVPVAALGPVIPPPPGVILLPPPGGGVVVPPPGGGVIPPGGGDHPPSPPPPPPPPPPAPPAVPEPGTWMTMILGFGLIGWILRRKRREPKPA